MGLAAIVMLFAATILAAMIFISRRADARLPVHGDVPTHFDIRGNADGFGSRWVVLGAMPVVYICMNVLLVILSHFFEDEASAGEVLGTHLFMGIALLATHVFIVWLLMRWVRNGGAR